MLVLAEEVGPAALSCRVCNVAIEAAVADVFDHYASEHPIGSAAAVCGAVGILWFVGSRRRG